MRLSRLVEEISEISELDLNPILAQPLGQGCRIVDAKFVLRFLKHSFTPEKSQVRQCVGEFLIGHGCIREHACARVSFPNCTRALLVSFQI